MKIALAILPKWIDSRAKWHSLLATVLMCLVSLAPLCGWLFKCGCTWPGLGLDALCNYHHFKASHQCPWCVSLWASGFSIGFALLAGVWVSMLAQWEIFPHIESLLRVFAGLLTFTLVSALTGWLVAIMQDYPLVF